MPNTARWRTSTRYTASNDSDRVGRTCSMAGRSELRASVEQLAMAVGAC